MLIAYGYENEKLWFGRVTFKSWLRAFFRDGGLLDVKPIKGYEEYAYYRDVLRVEISDANLANFRNEDADPIWMINWAEKAETNGESRLMYEMLKTLKANTEIKE